VSSAAADPVTTPGHRCGPGTVDLTATSPDPVIWYDAPTGGTQVDTGLTFTTPSISTTTTYYAEANNGCVSNRVSAVATVDALAADPVTTDGERCGTGTVDISASAADPVTWWDAPSGGNQIGTGSALTTPVISATTIFYAIANNGTCPSNPIAANAVVHMLPAVNLGPDTTLITPGPPYFIDAGAGFITYIWSNGATSQGISVTNPDTFCVTVTDANGCTNTDCVSVDFSNGVLNPALANLVSIYPNPTNGIISIQLSPEIMDSEIRIASASGQLLFLEETHGGQLHFDLHSYAKGIYVVTVTTKSGIINKRMTIE
jgi:hypothetical protein